MMNSPSLSIIVPVYNESESIRELYTQILPLMQNFPQWELIFVDDGSGDASWAELLRVKQQREATKLVKLARNFGAVSASKTGFQFVSGDCFLILAADLQDPLQLIPDMARIIVID